MLWSARWMTSDETVRFWACVALGRVKDQQIRLAPLLTTRQTDSSEKVRGAARQRLSAIDADCDEDR